MNKRLEMLEKLTSSGQAEALAWYGLAMEYRKLGRLDEALAAFQTLRTNEPEYLAMYLMAGQLLLENNRAPDARAWLEQGLAIAQRQGNHKTVGELQDALANC